MKPEIIAVKVWPKYFGDIISGKKPFEVRKDDRGYSVGKWLLLQEWEPIFHETGGYTGRDCTCEITYKLEGGQFGIEAGYCVLGIRLLDVAIPEKE